jgi:hypothetical protein
VIDKVFKPNKSKVLALNRTLNQHFKLVKLYLSHNPTLKNFSMKNAMKMRKSCSILNTALIQTARDEAIEILKNFERKNRKEDSLLRLKRISIRFDKRCHKFSKTTNVLTPLLAHAQP